MFWRRTKKLVAVPPVAEPRSDQLLREADQRLHEYEAQVNRMLKANDEMEAELARLRPLVDSSAASEARAQAAETSVAAYEEAFRRVGEEASYRLKKHKEESWPDYKRRVMALFENSRDSDLGKAILDLLAFKEREGYRHWIAAKTPEEAEHLRMYCRAHREARGTIQQAFAMAGSRSREEHLSEEKDFAAMELDDLRLASRPRVH